MPYNETQKKIGAADRRIGAPSSGDLRSFMTSRYRGVPQFGENPSRRLVLSTEADNNGFFRN
jgi:hypothetical protein